MKRSHPIQIHDQDWNPRAVRDAVTDYLQFVIATTKPCAAMVPALAAALQRTGSHRVPDWLVPVMVLLTTPFIRPFRWSRLLWTYLIPVAPLTSLFDGLVSCMRTDHIHELRELTEGLDATQYQGGRSAN